VSPVSYERDLAAATDAVERLLRDRVAGSDDRAFAADIVQRMFGHGWRPTEATRYAPSATGPRAAEYGPPEIGRHFLDRLRRRNAGEPVAWPGTILVAGS
jgi:hypothetical protein